MYGAAGVGWASTLEVRKGTRCSVELWSESSITRIDAQRRCDADGSCLGLMWFAANGGDGRTALDGWFQGCGVAVGTEQNSAWDTILKPPAVLRLSTCHHLGGSQAWAFKEIRD